MWCLNEKGTHAHTHRHMHPHTRKHTHRHMHTHTCTHIQTHTHIHRHSHIGTCTHTQACREAHVHICTHTERNAHAHKHSENLLKLQLQGWHFSSINSELIPCKLCHFANDGNKLLNCKQICGVLYFNGSSLLVSPEHRIGKSSLSKIIWRIFRRGLEYNIRSN